MAERRLENELKIRGLNLGGWLVSERWMTPLLYQSFGVEDESSLVELLPHAAAKDLFTTHRKTFITEKDFAFIAERGFNSLRLPIPWYVFGQQGPDPKKNIGCIEYVDFCMEQAHKHGLSVLLDLHTVPGGQNGFDNSSYLNQIEWHLDDDNRIVSLTVLSLLAKRYKDNPALFGIELMNEPKLAGFKGLRFTQGIPAHYLRNFYRAAYKLLREDLDSDKAIVIHDAFEPAMWKGFMSSQDYENVWLDLHRYHCFGPEVETIHKGRNLHLEIKKDSKAIKTAAKGNKKVMIGEWSGALAIPQNEMTPEGRKAFERVFIRRQLKEFAKADAWYFWSYKLENDMAAWDARKALAFLEKDVLCS